MIGGANEWEIHNSEAESADCFAHNDVRRSEALVWEKMKGLVLSALGLLNLGSRSLAGI